MLDTTIVNVALPSIAAGIHAQPAALEWVVSGYVPAFGLALVPAGRLGDRYGYKVTFLAGLALFTLASLGCGLAQTPIELITARVVQGLGAGIYFPAISATIQRLFGGRQRSKAFGYLGGVVGLSTAVGPLIGCLLIQAGGIQDGWRRVFLVNVFVAAVGLPAAARMLPRRHQPEPHRLDSAGTALLAVTLLLLLVPLVEGRAAGWPFWSWICLACALPAAALLTWWESRLAGHGGEPVLQHDLYRHRSFTMAQLLALCYFAGFTSLFFTLSILWQQGLGHSALETGLLVIPFALGGLLTASNSDRFSTRFGRTTVLAGIGGMLPGRRCCWPSCTWAASTRPVAAGRAAGPGRAGQRAGHRAQPGLRARLRAPPAGRHGGRCADHRAAGRRGHRHRRDRDRTVRQRLRGERSGGGSSSGSGSARVMPSLVHTAQWATAANLAFVLAALACALGLPRSLGAERAAENA